jgi:hypothetical protein
MVIISYLLFDMICYMPCLFFYGILTDETALNKINES